MTPAQEKSAGKSAKPWAPADPEMSSEACHRCFSSSNCCTCPQNSHFHRQADMGHAP